MASSDSSTSSEYIFEFYDDFDNELDIKDEWEILNKEHKYNPNDILNKYHNLNINNLILIDFIEYFDSFYYTKYDYNTNYSKTSNLVFLSYFYIKKFMLLSILCMFDIIHKILLYVLLDSMCVQYTCIII